MDSNLFIIFGLMCGGLFSFLVGGIGIFLIIRFQRSRVKARESLNWQSATGKVNFTEVQTSTGIDERYRYTPIVYYSYQVGDQTYESTRIALGREYKFALPQKAEEKLAKYPPEREITIYYDPKNPEDAVLERQVVGTKGGLIVGILLTATMLLMLCSLLYLVVDFILRIR